MACKTVHPYELLRDYDLETVLLVQKLNVKFLFERGQEFE